MSLLSEVRFIGGANVGAICRKKTGKGELQRHTKKGAQLTVMTYGG